MFVNTFPSKYKTANVKLLLKKATKNENKNYRPKFLLSLTSKGTKNK